MLSLGSYYLWRGHPKGTCPLGLCLLVLYISNNQSMETHQFTIILSPSNNSDRWGSLLARKRNTSHRLLRVFTVKRVSISDKKKSLNLGFVNVSLQWWWEVTMFFMDGRDFIGRVWFGREKIGETFCSFEH